MFGLSPYIDKIFEIEWSFPTKDKKDLESLLFVEFDTIGNNKHKIKTVKYTYVDILLGLEELNFTFEKLNDKYRIVIK